MKSLSLEAEIGRRPTDEELSDDWYARAAARPASGLRATRAINPLDWTQAEIDGLSAAAAMEELASVQALDLVVPVWLERLNGISQAARVVYAIISDFRGITADGIAARVGEPWGSLGWSRYVDEAVAFGIVVRGAGGELRVKLRSV